MTQNYKTFEDAKAAVLEKNTERGALNWWYGDWWSSTEHYYGERKALIESDEWDGPAYASMMVCGTVARAFPATTFPRRKVSFSVAKAIAARPEYWQEAIDDKWSKRVAEKKMRGLRDAEEYEQLDEQERRIADYKRKSEEENAENRRRLAEVPNKLEPRKVEKAEKVAPLPPKVTPEPEAPKGLRVVADNEAEIKRVEGINRVIEVFEEGLDRAVQEGRVETIERALRYLACPDFWAELDDDLRARAAEAVDKYDTTRKHGLKIVK